MSIGIGISVGLGGSIVPPPAITGFLASTPNFGATVGDTVPRTLQGSKFTGASAVALVSGGTDYACTFSVVSDTEISITAVPAVAAGDYGVKVTTPGGSTTLAAVYEAIPIAAWYRADNVTLDGSNNVSAELDYTNSDVDFTQGTAGDRPNWTASDSDWGNKPSITHTGGRRTAGASKSAFKALWDGTGGSLFLPHKMGSNAGFAEFGTGVAGTGANVGQSIIAQWPSADDLTYGRTNGSAFVILMIASGYGTTGTKTFYSAQYKTGASPNGAAYSGTTQIDDDAERSTPSSADASLFPTWGAGNNAGSFAANYTTPERIVLGTYVTSGQRSKINSYLQARYA